MSSKIGIIISREYTERVKKKSFIVTTLLMPLFMLAMMVLPSLLMLFNSPESTRIALSDASGQIAPTLLEKSASACEFVATDEPLESLMADDSFDAILVIGPDIVANPSDVTLYTRDAGSIETEGMIASTIENVVEDIRLQAYNIDNINEILDEVKANVNLTTLRLDEKGEATTSSSMLSFIVGLVTCFILYMFLLMYGQMVMTSIIEEKGNRVLELVVSSVKPTQLMLGKILGIGLVAVTQVIIWAVLVASMVSFLLPVLLPTEMLGEMSALNAGTLDAASATTDIELLQAVTLVGSVGFVLKIFGFMLLFLVGGFLFYSSLMAAIGSSVDNIQDASQLQSFVVVPIILALMFSLSVGNAPNSTLALWLSMIPFTSPMVMMTRIPFGIPAWEIVVSALVLYASIVVVVWFAAKIYRVGIFMYGKKPTIKELIRWARYK